MQLPNVMGSQPRGVPPPPIFPPVLPPPYCIPPVGFIPPQAYMSTAEPMALNSQNSAVIECGPVLYKNDKKNKLEEAAKCQNGMKPKVQVLNPAWPKDLKGAEKAKGHSSKSRKNQKPDVCRRYAGGQYWEDQSLAEWDPNDFRIFCGDLGNEVSEEVLNKAFRKYPSFQKAKVIRDATTNRSKGYGFISFKDHEDFIRAYREMNGKYVGNRPIKLRKSKWKERNFDMAMKKKIQKKKFYST